MWVRKWILGVESFIDSLSILHCLIGKLRKRDKRLGSWVWLYTLLYWQVLLLPKCCWCYSSSSSVFFIIFFIVFFFFLWGCELGFPYDDAKLVGVPLSCHVCWRQNSPPHLSNSLVIVVVVTATNGHFKACNPIMELSCFILMCYPTHDEATCLLASLLACLLVYGR